MKTLKMVSEDISHHKPLMSIATYESESYH